MTGKLEGTLQIVMIDIVYAEWITAQVKPPTEHLYTSTGGSPEEFSGKVINHNPGIPDQQESQRESD